MVAILLGVIFWDGRFLNVWISFPLSAITIIAAVLIFGFNRVERYSLLNIKIWNVSKEF